MCRIKERSNGNYPLQKVKNLSLKFIKWKVIYYMINKISSISSLLSKYIGVIIICFSVWAFYQPATFAWATSYTAWLLGVAMFGMGLTIHGKDFKIVLTQPKNVLVGCLAQYTIMPLSAYALAKMLQLPDDLALGVILVGCCPGGTASNVITYIAGGDVALSVGMTTVSTLLAPLLTPILVYSLGGAWVDVSFMAMVLSVVKIVLVPVLMGIAIHTLCGAFVKKISGVLPLVSVISIVLLIAGIVANNVEKILTCGILVLIVVMLHNAIGLVIGLTVARACHIEYTKETAIAIEVAMQNSGLAISLATINFAANPLATLPGAIFSVWHNISGSIFASLRRNKKEQLVEATMKPALE